MMQHRILVMYIQIHRYMKANQLEDRLVKSKWCGIRCSIPLRTSALYVRIENCLISILLYSGEFFHADLLTMEAHTPSPKPQRYQKKGGDWYNQDYVDGSKTRGKKGTTLLIVCILYILWQEKKQSKEVLSPIYIYIYKMTYPLDNVLRVGLLTVISLGFLEPKENMWIYKHFWAT